MSGKVRLKNDSFIAEIVLDNPPVNALGSETVIELFEATEQISDWIKSRQTRVVILRSKGKHFCAGADLKERLKLDDSEVSVAVKKIRKAVDGIWNIRVPVLALIHGVALGGGMELALAADIRLAADDSKMGLKEVSLAIMPGAGGTQRLPRIVGMGKALEWITTAKDISPEEGLKSGLLNEIMPANILLERGLELAKSIASNGPIGVQSAKKAVRDGFDRKYEDAMEIEWSEYLKTVPTQDRLEGLNAFKDGRIPKYEGR
ncbi:MAG: enoyl-CoA hydratase/isomerase family protein [Candidatus Marinimicrobia bacterium]|nr:enoyl-CoA hydratase/isomerase family protein [Candidatus Neomarinimicrobiota bacterium]